jgi:hypothetical protein
MDVAEAIRIIKALADGVDPFTGQAFSPDSPYQQADTVRASYLAVEALDQLDKTISKENRLPDNAGKPWQAQEGEDLIIAFEDGMTIRELARRHQRTVGSIIAIELYATQLRLR